jgi:uncharacterized protein (DUF362 family)
MSETEFMKEMFELLPERGPHSDCRPPTQKSCLGLTRRTFLKGGGATLAALSMPAYASSVSHAPRSRVAVVRRDSIEEMTRYAVLLAGGLYEIKNGETVFIKPNLVVSSDALGNRVTTHPEVLRAVIRAVKERTTPKNITVGDRSMFTIATLTVAETCGIFQVCAEEGVNFLPLESGDYINFIHPSFEHFKRPIAIPEVLSTFDHFINVPMCKNHTAYRAGELRESGLGFRPPPNGESLPDNATALHARVTLCMNNVVGLMPFDPKIPESNRRVNSGLHQSDIGEKIAELNLCVPKITMNVIDAVSAFAARGPVGPQAVYAEPNLVIASKDRVACDSVGLAVLRYHAEQCGVTPEAAPYIDESVWRSPQIARAGALGLGHASAANIKLISRGVPEMDAIEKFWV